MSEVLELNREEITRLSSMDDFDGYAWSLYLILKNNMDIYTGVVQVETNVLAKVLFSRLKHDSNFNKNSIEDNLRSLMNLLVKAQVIIGYNPDKEYVSIRLPIAISETCLETTTQH